MINPTIVFQRANEVVIEDRKIPKVDSGQVLIKTQHTLISTGTELTMLSGDFPADSLWATRWAKYPNTPGYCNIGEIIELGDGVDESMKGKRVASCGSHAMYNALPADAVNLIAHQEIKGNHAAFFTISGIVMNGVRKAKLELGDSVAVFGLGLLGQLAVRYARLSGCQPVFAIDISEERLALLPNDPNIIKINPMNDDVKKKIAENTNERMVDVAFEVTGNQKLIPDEIQVVKRQGKFILLSSPRGETSFNFCDLCNYPSYSIIGAHTLSHPALESADNQWTFPRNTELFFNFLHTGELKMQSLITHQENFEKAPELYAMLLKDRSKSMGAILNWQ